jgi:hypothetical protein
MSSKHTVEELSHISNCLHLTIHAALAKRLSALALVIGVIWVLRSILLAQDMDARQSMMTPE